MLQLYLTAAADASLSSGEGSRLRSTYGPSSTSSSEKPEKSGLKVAPLAGIAT
jgi:hypothetical protein